jgi:2-dehydropantoate 2-reductase
VIGSDLDGKGADALVTSFKSCGLKTYKDDRITDAIWLKAIVNACVNPIAAILRVPNGKLIESAVISRLMKDVSLECELVARASGVRVPTGSTYARLRSVCEDTRGNTSSMLQDVLRRRRTEIDQINGAICSLGDRCGISTPLNSALSAMISSMPLE